MGHSDLYDQASDLSERGLKKMGSAARRGMEHLADSMDQMRTQVSRTSDRALGYVQEEPVRAALIALAVGTLVIAAWRMIGSRASR